MQDKMVLSPQARKEKFEKWVWDLIHAEFDWAREENIQLWSETAKIPRKVCATDSKKSRKWLKNRVNVDHILSGSSRRHKRQREVLPNDKWSLFSDQEHPHSTHSLIYWPHTHTSPCSFAKSLAQKSFQTVKRTPADIPVCWRTQL